MAKRIYWETVKSWAIKVGIPTGVAGVALLFYYLVFIQAIIITGSNGDTTCAGTIDDPCIALINFTAREDVFIYPVGYDPWGRDTPFYTDKGLESWKIYRSWGKGWREIKLSQTCTSTWCGAPPNSPDNKYSIAFREGRDYQIKIVAYKENPNEDIKWGFGPLDPTWYGVNESFITEYGVTHSLTVPGHKIVNITSVRKNQTWLEFDGDGRNNMTIPYNNMNLTENVSIAFSFNQGSSGDDADQYFVSMRDNACYDFNVWIHQKESFKMIDGSGSPIDSLVDVSAGDVWDKVVYVINDSGTGWKVYKNGVPNKEVSITHLDSCSNQFLFGAREGSTINDWTGDLQSFIIYNKTLSREEVKEIYLNENLTGVENDMYFYVADNSEDGGSTRNYTAVRIPYQRNSFYMNGRYWLIYGNFTSNNTEYISSNTFDNWTSPTIIGKFNRYSADWSVVSNGSVIDYYSVNNWSLASAHKGLNYTRGVPLANGTINWSQTFEIWNDANITDDISPVIDSLGFPWFSDADEMLTSNYNNGTWETNQSSMFDTTRRLISSLNNSDLYVITVYWDSNSRLHGSYFNGTDRTYTGEDLITESRVESESGETKVSRVSAVGCGDKVHLVFQSDNTDIRYKVREDYSWSAETILESDMVTQISSHPVITCGENEGEVFVFWEYQDSPTDKILMKHYDGSVWRDTKVIILDNLNDHYGQIQSYQNQENGTIGLTYLSEDLDIVHVLYTNNSNILNNNDLLLRLKLNENSGTTAYDVSGNSNDGTISGATWNDDGIWVDLIEGIDYLINRFTGAWDLLNQALDRTGVNISYNYNDLNVSFGEGISSMEFRPTAYYGKFWPTNQTWAIGVFNVTNNGTALAQTIGVRVNQTQSGWNIECDNSTTEPWITLTTSHQTIYSNLDADESFQVWCRAVLNNPSEIYRGKIYFNITS